MDTRFEKLQKLLSDETVAKDVLSSSLEETQANLKAKGLEFSLDELNDIVKGIVSASNESEEIGESELENVSGGGYKKDCYNAGRTIGKGFKFAVTWAVAIFK